MSRQKSEEGKAEAPQAPPRTPEEKMREARSALGRILLSALFGVLAGALSFLTVTGDLLYKNPAGTARGVFLLLTFILLQVPLDRHLRIAPTSKKEWASIGFLTFTLWFLTWSALVMGSAR
ncbi:MAG: hypothetical protein HY558_07985 [Euryarchaeota archaeon]|nr:hypothetical protein [Euryarchaeota archaeon]